MRSSPVQRGQSFSHDRAGFGGPVVSLVVLALDVVGDGQDRYLLLEVEVLGWPVARPSPIGLCADVIGRPRVAATRCAPTAVSRFLGIPRRDRAVQSNPGTRLPVGVSAVPAAGVIATFVVSPSISTLTCWAAPVTCGVRFPGVASFVPDRPLTADQPPEQTGGEQTSHRRGQQGYVVHRHGHARDTDPCRLLEPDPADNNRRTEIIASTRLARWSR